MANTKISDLGGRAINRSCRPSKLLYAQGNGTLKAGSAVYIGSNGKVAGTATTTAELFAGFLDDDPRLEDDTAIPDGEPAAVIVPDSGEVYAVRIVDPTASASKGTPVGFSETAGSLEVKSALADAVATLYEDVASGDTVALVRWL